MVWTLISIAEIRKIATRLRARLRRTRQAGAGLIGIGYQARTGTDWAQMSMEMDEPPPLEPPSVRAGLAADSGEPSNFILGEIQVLLSEKRTALASLRTGIAVFALPLSVLSVLIATSRYYTFEKVIPLLLPLLILNLGLVVLGSWLIYHSIRRLRHYDRRIRDLTQKYRSLADFID